MKPAPTRHHPKPSHPSAKILLSTVRCSPTSSSVYAVYTLPRQPGATVTAHKHQPSGLSDNIFSRFTVPPSRILSRVGREHPERDLQRPRTVCLSHPLLCRRRDAVNLYTALLRVERRFSLNPPRALCPHRRTCKRRFAAPNFRQGPAPLSPASWTRTCPLGSRNANGKLPPHSKKPALRPQPIESLTTLGSGLLRANEEEEERPRSCWVHLGQPSTPHRQRVTERG